MAEDFPEDKYDFKVQKDERTFALNLLHAAALDYVLIRRISGSNLGPDFGEGDNPTRDQFKTKADVVKFVQEAVADGAQVIQQQGDAGLDKTTKFFGNRLAHNSSIWTFAIEHSGEHYGQLVVYYRANNLVPPDTRRHQAQLPQQPSAARVVDLKASDGTILKATYFAAAKQPDRFSPILDAQEREEKLSYANPQVIELIDYYDPATNFTSMQRTTGWHLSIVASLMAQSRTPIGSIPLEVAVPGETFVREARRRGFNITEQVSPA
jgi:uncharacterized damage-inducible protein DinB